MTGSRLKDEARLRAGLRFADRRLDQAATVAATSRYSSIWSKFM